MNGTEKNTKKKDDNWSESYGIDVDRKRIKQNV